MGQPLTWQNVQTYSGAGAIKGFDAAINGVNSAATILKDTIAASNKNMDNTRAENDKALFSYLNNMPEPERIVAIQQIQQGNLDSLGEGVTAGYFSTGTTANIAKTYSDYAADREKSVFSQDVETQNKIASLVKLGDPQGAQNAAAKAGYSVLVAQPFINGLVAEEQNRITADNINIANAPSNNFVDVGNIDTGSAGDSLLSSLGDKVSSETSAIFSQTLDKLFSGFPGVQIPVEGVQQLINLVGKRIDSVYTKNGNRALTDDEAEMVINAALFSKEGQQLWGNMVNERNRAVQTYGGNNNNNNNNNAVNAQQFSSAGNASGTPDTSNSNVTSSKTTPTIDNLVPNESSNIPSKEELAEFTENNPDSKEWAESAVEAGVNPIEEYKKLTSSSPEENPDAYVLLNDGGDALTQPSDELVNSMLHGNVNKKLLDEYHKSMNGKQSYYVNKYTGEAWYADGKTKIPDGFVPALPEDWKNQSLPDYSNKSEGVGNTSNLGKNNAELFGSNEHTANAVWGKIEQNPNYDKLTENPLSKESQDVIAAAIANDPNIRAFQREHEETINNVSKSIQKSTIKAGRTLHTTYEITFPDGTKKIYPNIPKNDELGKDMKKIYGTNRSEKTTKTLDSGGYLYKELGKDVNTQDAGKALSKVASTYRSNMKNAQSAADVQKYRAQAMAAVYNIFNGKEGNTKTKDFYNKNLSAIKEAFDIDEDVPVYMYSDAEVEAKTNLDTKQATAAVNHMAMQKWLDKEENEGIRTLLDNSAKLLKDASSPNSNVSAVLNSDASDVQQLQILFSHSKGNSGVLNASNITKYNNANIRELKKLGLISENGNITAFGNAYLNWVKVSAGKEAPLSTHISNDDAIKYHAEPLTAMGFDAGGVTSGLLLNIDKFLSVDATERKNLVEATFGQLPDTSKGANEYAKKTANYLGEIEGDSLAKDIVQRLSRNADVTKDVLEQRVRLVENMLQNTAIFAESIKKSINQAHLSKLETYQTEVIKQAIASRNKATSGDFNKKEESE